MVRHPFLPERHYPVNLPEIASLRCFIAAVHHRSFRAAAAAVALSPSAFSARIRQLEDIVGCALFERSARHVRLTPTGERLLPHARACVDAAGLCVVAAQGAPMPWSAWVGTRFELGLSWLVPALDVLRAAQPERTVHLSFGSDAELLRQLEIGSLDAVISSVRIAGELRYAHLHQEEYAFVCTRPLTDPEAIQREILLDTGVGLPLFRYLLDALPAEANWQFKGMEYLGTIAAIRYRVLRGAGVAVLPRYFVAADLAAGTLVEILPHIRPRSDSFRLIWRPDHPREKGLRELAETLRLVPLC